MSSQTSESCARRASLSGSFDTAQASLTLEAMRLGVVPSADLFAYTVGRARELDLIDRDLAQAAERGGAVRAFLGDYGTGKTHLLELIQNRALREGFLVARVTVDSRETTPSHPKRIYRGLVRSLRYPEQTREEALGLRPLLLKGSQSQQVSERFCLERKRRGSIGERLEEGAHLYLTPALQYFRTLSHLKGDKKPRPEPIVAAALDLATDWIEGHPTISNQVIDTILARALGRRDKIYSLLDFRPWARIYGYLLNGLSTLARQVGYKGLVLLVDEAEFYSMLSAENREFAEGVFKALTYAAVGGRHTDKEPLPFDKADLDRGGYGIQQSLPTVYDQRAGLYTVFAMTPNPDGMAALHSAVPMSRTHELSPLGREDYVELASKVCDFYASSRPDWALPEALVTPLGKVISGLIGSGLVENPRQAVKFIIDFIDIVRYRPERIGQVIKNLQNRLTF